MLKKIFKIKIKFVALAVVVLIALQVITAYFFGFMAEKRFDDQFHKLTDNQFITVVDRSYKRGFFTSTEQVTLEFNNQSINNLIKLLPVKSSESAVIPNGNYKISYTSHITTGIFAGWLNGSIMPTLAYSNIDISYPSSLDSILKTFFKDKTPITISKMLYLTGDGKYEVLSPAFNYEEALSGVKVNWGGLKLIIGFNDTFDKFNSKLSAKHFDFSAPTKGNLTIDNIAYSSNSTRSINDIKVGNATFSVDNLNIDLIESNQHLKLGSIVNSVTGINSVDFLNDIDVINPLQMQLTKVKYASHSEDVNNYFSANVVVSFESLVSMNNTYGPFDFDFDLNHIRADKFSSVADLLATNSKLNESDYSANYENMVSQLKSGMTPILIESPIAKINKLTLKVPSGLINIDGVLTTHGFESADMLEQSQFMQKIYANVNLSVPKPVLGYLLLLQMKYFLSAGNAQMDEQSSQALSKLVNILLDNQLQNWVRKGYIKEEAESVFSSNIRFESGVIYLNNLPTHNE
ncbi:MAG: YdgA family protein [Burkholderiales bacterium]|nr:YdgA family protein [Burkholderiales bacterium]